MLHPYGRVLRRAYQQILGKIWCLTVTDTQVYCLKSREKVFQNICPLYTLIRTRWITNNNGVIVLKILLSTYPPTQSHTHTHTHTHRGSHIIYIYVCVCMYVYLCIYNLASAYIFYLYLCNLHILHIWIIIYIVIRLSLSLSLYISVCKYIKLYFCELVWVFVCERDERERREKERRERRER